jgi:hypothetical protein
MVIQAGSPKERQDADNKASVQRRIRRLRHGTLQCLHKVLGPENKNFDANKSPQREVRAAAREKKIEPTPSIFMQRRSVCELNKLGRAPLRSKSLS